MTQPLGPLIDHTPPSPRCDLRGYRSYLRGGRGARFRDRVRNLGLGGARCGRIGRFRGRGLHRLGLSLGAVATAAKVAEAREAVRSGATELDVVVHLGALLDRHYRTVVADLRAVVDAADGRVVKVILETAALTDDQIRVGAALAQSAGASFVKTSSGFGPGGATVEAVRILAETVCKEIGVKASGGIRDEATARAMLEAGATRLGTSAGVAIVGAAAAGASTSAGAY